MPPKLPKKVVNPAFQTAARADTNVSHLFGTSSDFPQVVEINLADIDTRPEQPRRHFDGDALRSLAESINKHGLQQPILVSPQSGVAGQGTSRRYTLCAGERRYRAHQLLGRDTIYAVITKGDADEIALIENLQRVDLDLFEKSDGFARMTDFRGYTHEGLAEVVGYSRTEVTSILSLQRLSPTIRKECATSHRETSKSILFELASVADHAQQEELWTKVKNGMKTTELRSAKKASATSPGMSPPHQQSILRMVSTSRRFVREIEAVHAAVQANDAALDDAQRQELQQARDLIDRLLGSAS
ncbi:ParB/RepB/Spo0J family partition protein [Azospirillum canadense]|uniref:ParB/RepB/Spo0J family partition protein n=1 Tax=Azospirillum canadense TaxID=403962 RepID=UPI002225CD58|nr:ParB/RepB/Spo0J family partition protein [Azospirillum canadense]MCW2240380.1 ParB family chromosome partitioning protein [Azospirillum canadense]